MDNPLSGPLGGSLSIRLVLSSHSVHVDQHSRLLVMRDIVHRGAVGYRDFLYGMSDQEDLGSPFKESSLTYEGTPPLLPPNAAASRV